MDTIKRNKLLDACFNGCGDIFTELRKLRKSTPTIANVIDEVAEDIPQHFAGIYRKLYNSVDDREELSDILQKLNAKICPLSVDEVMKVTPEMVKSAANHLKGNKSDPLCHFTSDCLKNAQISSSTSCILI